MSVSRHRTAIEELLISSFAISRSSMVLVGENANSPSGNNAAWARMSVTVLSIYFPCIGQDGFKRTDALFNFQIFTPLATGAEEASDIVDEAIDILRNSAISGIEFLEFDVSTGDVQADWYNLTMRATYRADD